MSGGHEASSRREERADKRAHEDVPEGSGGSSRPEDSGLLHLILNAALMAAFAFLFFVAGNLPDSRWEPLGSGTFPRIVLACLILLNAITIVSRASHAREELRARGKEFSAILVETLHSSRLVIATFAVFGVFLFAIQFLGFVLSTFVFILVVQLMLGPISRKSIIMALVIALVTSIGVDFIFETYFNVFLPTQRLW